MGDCVRPLLLAGLAGESDAMAADDRDHARQVRDCGFGDMRAIAETLVVGIARRGAMACKDHATGCLRAPRNGARVHRHGCGKHESQPLRSHSR
jgi:hypothetical protein